MDNEDTDLVNSPDKPLIMVDLYFSYGYNVQVARGISRFRSTRPHWTFVACHTNKLNKSYRGIQGAIGQFLNPEKDLPAFQKNGIKQVISVSNSRPQKFWSSVLVDDVAVGRMAADYFLRKGFRRFATLGIPGITFSDQRIEGFCARLAEKQIHHVPNLSRNDLAKLVKQPDRFPLALFKVTDHLAFNELRAILDAGIRVPHDVAVLGVDNDEMIEPFTPTPLSSIQIPGEEIGFQACELMERLLLGKESEPRKILLPPIGVVERTSTELIAVEDPRVRRVQLYMEEHLASIVSMEEVAQALHMHRRSMDRLFSRQLGITPADWLTGRRVERAEKLLLETNYTVDTIAEMTGLEERRRLLRACKKFSRPMPSVLRKKGKYPPEQK